MKHLDLFSGIGGFALAAKKVGWETIGFSEVDPWCIKLLKQYWPNVPQLGSITELGIVPSSLRPDSPARTYPTQAEAPDLPASVPDSGGKHAVPFAWYDHSTRCWRTWQRCLEEGWAMCRETWPRAGMTRNGIAYRRVPLAPLTNGTGYGLLPTPNARDYRDISLKGTEYASQRSRHTPSLATEAYLSGMNGNTVANIYRWAMGYPEKWHHVPLKDTETPSSRKSPNKSSKQSKINKENNHG